MSLQFISKLIFSFEMKKMSLSYPTHFLCSIIIFFLFIRFFRVFLKPEYRKPDAPHAGYPLGRSLTTRHVEGATLGYSFVDVITVFCCQCKGLLDCLRGTRVVSECFCFSFSLSIDLVKLE